MWDGMVRFYEEHLTEDPYAKLADSIQTPALFEWRPSEPKSSPIFQEHVEIIDKIPSESITSIRDSQVFKLINETSHFTATCRNWSRNVDLIFELFENVELMDAITL